MITSACPVCGTVAARHAFDIGSGPELACASCEWCWGADGQDLKPIDVGEIRRWAQDQGILAEMKAESERGRDQ